MADKDPVWEHGVNLFPGFKCNYCLKERKGGGATRLKEHLAGRSGNVAPCSKIPPDVRDFFRRELQRIRERKKSIREERLSRVRSATPDINLVVDDGDEDEVIQRVTEQPRHEAGFQRKAGGRYEHGGGSGSGSGGGIRGLKRRVASQRESLSKGTDDLDLQRAKSHIAQCTDEIAATVKSLREELAATSRTGPAASHVQMPQQATDPHAALWHRIETIPLTPDQRVLIGEHLSSKDNEGKRGWLCNASDATLNTWVFKYLCEKEGLSL